jgi:hypothetical protein
MKRLVVGTKAFSQNVRTSCAFSSAPRQLMEAADTCAVAKRLDIIVPPDAPVYLPQDLPPRLGPRPKTHPCLPHYQMTDNPPKAVWEELVRRTFTVGAFPGADGPHRSLVSLPDSQALFMSPGAPAPNCFIGREFAHVHGASDASLHAVLSPADAATAIRLGWAELHLLAGARLASGTLAPGLVMVYAPRTAAEVDTVLDIIGASHAYARGGPPPRAS